MRRAGLAAACVAVLVALTGCATDPGIRPGEGGSDTTAGVPMTPSTTPEPATPAEPGATTSSAPPELTATTPPPGSEVTVTGTVVLSEVELGCLMLEGYELYGGDPAVLQPGRRVRVSGVIATDVMSICQQGPILRVISAQAA